MDRENEILCELQLRKTISILSLFLLTSLFGGSVSSTFVQVPSLQLATQTSTTEPITGITQEITIKVSISATPERTLPGIVVLLPPNGRVADVRFSESGWSVYGYTLAESFFRSYKLAYFRFGGASYSYGSHEVTFVISPTGPMMRHVEWDEVASPLMSYLRSKDLWFNNAFCRFVSSGKIDEWSAYPALSVGRRSVFTFPIYVPKIKYVAIVPEAWASLIQPLLSWKREKGLPAMYFTVEWIDSSYAGSSLAARIREFLKDAFNSWQIDYVLLVGGATRIPPGNYECLDGDEDAFPDLAVGRLPADSFEDLTTMINKIMKYEQQTIVSAKSANFLGILGQAEVINARGPPMKAIPLPSSLHPTWLVYGRNLTSPNQINSCIQAGTGVVYENTHGNPNGWWLGWELENYRFDHALSLRNTLLPVVLAAGCNTSDYRWPNCVGTAFLRNPSGGAVAYLGWFGLGGAAPPSLGCNSLSTLFNISNWKPGVSIVQGCVFTYPNNLYGPGFPGRRETREILLGDPETSVWTISPRDLALSTVPSGSLLTVRVTDKSTQRPMEGITVRVLAADFLEMTTDDLGQIAFKAPMSSGEFTYNVYALYRNKPNRFTITVTTTTTAITTMTTTSSTSATTTTTMTTTSSTSTLMVTSTASPISVTTLTTITSRVPTTIMTTTTSGSALTTYTLRTTQDFSSTSLPTGTTVTLDYTTTQLSKTGTATLTSVSTSATTTGNTVFETVIIRLTYIEQFFEKIVQGKQQLIRIIQKVFVIVTVRETVVKVEPHTSTVSTTTSYQTTRVWSPRCVIATAAYGSELMPEVQFLRSFRDESIMPTFVGKSFMSVFDYWYYSSSPFVAELISNNPTARSVMRVALCPLMEILRFSSCIYSIFTFNPEIAAVVVGLVIGSLIGIVYLLLPIVLVSVIVGKRNPVRQARKPVSRSFDLHVPCESRVC